MYTSSLYTLSWNTQGRLYWVIKKLNAFNILLLGNYNMNISLHWIVELPLIFPQIFGLQSCKHFHHQVAAATE